MLRGNKISNDVKSVILDLHQMRSKEYSTLSLRRSRELLPFEGVGDLEHLVSKFNCSLFTLGTHQKKRPDNLIMGRMYTNHLLDMFEFCVANYVAATQFKVHDINYELKPILIF
jgi:ribosome production factor 2